MTFSEIKLYLTENRLTNELDWPVVRYDIHRSRARPEWIVRQQFMAPGRNQPSWSDYLPLGVVLRKIEAGDYEP